MGWYVVKFEDEDTVEAVPKTWYLKGTKECNWPPLHWNSNKVNDGIKLRKAPENDWNRYKAVILGAYDDLSIAQRKADKAKHTSDISSQNDEFRERRHSNKRGKKNNKSTTHLSDIESSDLSRSDESDTNIYPSPSALITKDKNLQNLPVETVTKSTTECETPRRILDTDFQKHVIKELNAIHLKLNDVLESVALLLKNKRMAYDSPTTAEDIPHVVHLFPVDEMKLFELEQWLVDDENKAVK